VKGIGTPNPVSNRDDLPCSLWRNDKLAAEIHDIRTECPRFIGCRPSHADPASNSESPSLTKTLYGAIACSRKFLIFSVKYFDS